MRRVYLTGVIVLIGLGALPGWGAVNDARPLNPNVSLLFAQEWLRTVDRWDQCPRAVSFLGADDPELRFNSREAVFRIWMHDPHPPELLERETRVELRLFLSNSMRALTTQGRKTALEFLDGVGASGPESVCAVLVCLTDSHPQVSGLAEKIADWLFSSRDDARIVAAVVETVGRYKSMPGLLGVALDRLDRMGPKGKAAAIDLAVEQFVQTYNRAAGLLRDGAWNDEAQIARVVEFGPDVPYAVEVDSIYDAMAFSKVKGQARASALLGGGERGLRKIVAQTIAEDSARFDRYAILLGVVTHGVKPSAEVLDILRLDSKIVSPMLLPLLKKDDPTVQLAVLDTIKAVGVEGDETRAALRPLLYDLNDDVYFAAAELLGRQDILGRRIIPQLLVDLRSDSPNQRSIAARQLDEFRLEADSFTKALIRAVDRRDMPARTGLINALREAYEARGDAVKTLQRTAGRDDDPAARNFARAALREMDLTKAQNEAKP